MSGPHEPGADSDRSGSTPTADLEEIKENLNRELLEAREFAISQTFGGRHMFRLLSQRNPELNLILNAGIIAGIRQADWMKLSSAWQESAWRMLREAERSDEQ